ncbi:MAG: phenylalanine--tRNA ligase subunit alpha [Neisseriaceae bacterium]|nr:phenylalanine--tRNA ligase subunit alpha [Neisseriaceae bacterium]MCV2509126.1 phenylalanine--tRNA ligase subunit alpha [Neisseriaceae bacterium]
MDKQAIESLVTEGLQEIQKADDFNQLDVIKAKYLGKTGSLNAFLKMLGSLSPESRKEMGSFINTQKTIFQEAYSKKKNSLETQILEEKLKNETIDVTLDGRGQSIAGLHPITLTKNRMVSLFQSLGFEVADGPEIEEDYYCFEALNIPKNHPARAMQDTFYIEGNKVLRPHTSPIQIHYMLEKKNPPIRVVAPGRTYRVDSDATHSPMFHQLEGLWVDEGVSFIDLKSVFTNFLQAFFEREDLVVRFRPSFFPFTEPSAEIDIQWDKGWLEVGGCGMVHPNVLKNVNIDAEKYTGFAFGLGIDRYAMLRYGIHDLRLFFDNDLNFLKQFN